MGVVVTKDYMVDAFKEAEQAYNRGEVPIGAVIVRGDKIIARGFNKRERTQNALNHAEIIAIKRACKKLKSWRLDDCTMYVTLQPCVMCAGAILNSRIKKVVIGARSDRINDLEIFTNNNLNWKTEVEISEQEVCSEILRKFFAEKR
ncbi:MAG: nucleoside deaminase [Firmicutes bacterium]|nr:nucleoside deaminase [Bacillota bacterium]